MFLKTFVAFFIGFILCIVFVPICKYLARRFQVLDIPDPTRKIHSNPTPYLGGLAILVGILGVFLVDPALVIAKYLLGACLLWVVGTLDDKKNLNLWFRVVAELIAGVVAVALIPLYKFWHNPIEAIVIVAVIVVVVNSANLLDNIDGSLATVSLAVFVSLAINFYLLRELSLLLLCAVAVGSLGGFLIFNWPEAKIFMGDGGSLTIGYLLIVIVLSQAPRGGILKSLGSEIFFLTTFIIDTSVVVISRHLSHKSILTGGKDHITHRLLKKGLPNSITILTLGLFSFISGLIGVALQRNYLPSYFGYFWVAIWLVGVWLFVTQFSEID